nr:hypothetical protein [uncultured Bacteroides sp.]
MAAKTGEVMPRQQPFASPVPIGAPLPMDGSEKCDFRCHRLQEEVHRNRFMQTC